VNLQNRRQQAEGRHHSVQLPVGHLDGDERDDVVAHRREIHLASAAVEYAGAEQAPDARLRCVAGYAQRLGDFTDLYAGIADEFQQDLQISGVQTIQIVAFG
jgi:hypothetical protein